MPGPSDPSFWQERYETGDTRWDKGAPAPPLLSFLARHAVRGRVLVPGCGTGHDVRALAAQGATVTGLDFAPAAVEAARARPAVHDETYVEGDFFDLPESLRGSFDWIFEHTCFCAIDPGRRGDYVKACLQALRPGGRLLAIFYTDTGDPPDVGPPFQTTPAEITRHFSPFFHVEESSVPERSYPGREGRELLWLGRLSPTIS